MNEIAFADKKCQPKNAELTEVLGRSKKQWDAVVAYAQKAAPDAKAEWKHYGKASGWVLVLRGKKRNVLYMRPLAKRFRISFSLNDQAVGAAQESDLPADLVQAILDSPKYPEGRAARLLVQTARDATVAKKLVDIKCSH
jgi:hypothetical protein